MLGRLRGSVTAENVSVDLNGGKPAELQDFAVSRSPPPPPQQVAC